MAVQELLEGTAQSVRGVFGEGTAVYLGREEQGVKRPCVFLRRGSRTAARCPSDGRN